MTAEAGPAGFERVFELCDRVSGLRPEERRRTLERLVPAGEVGAALVREVESLLAHDPGPGRDEAAGGFDVHVTPDPPADGSARIAGYRLLGEIGRGGHGVVHRAEQAAPRREVAVKLLPGWAGRVASRRLREEGELLGRLRHPGIARVLGTGTDRIERDGVVDPVPRPWLAMELVDGEPLATWVERRRPAVSVRIRLVAAVADAVEHAHRRGVLHRDLKPSNVLVEDPGGAEPRPRILDFGIARLLEPAGDAARTRLTVDGQVLGTPGFMSPEQIDGDENEIDTRSDVFALGRLAWACLAGRDPVDAGTGPLLARLARAREARPEPLGRIDRRLDGDLELVVETAMHPDPARRYGSAAAFADDLRRVLARRPVAARRPSVAYVARRFVARQPVVVALGGVAAAALLAALVALSWGFGQARERALEAEAAAAEITARDAATLGAMVEIARALEPITGTEGVRRTALEDVVARLALRIERGDGDPALRRDYAAALEELTSIEEQLGDFDGMLEHARRALSIRRAIAGDGGGPEARRGLARSIVRLGDAHEKHWRDASNPQRRRDRAEAVARYHEAHATLLRLASDHPAHVGVLDDLQWSHDRMGHVYRDLEPDAAVAARHAAARRAVIERILALDPDHLHARRGLVKHLAQDAMGRTVPDEVGGLLAEAEAIARRLHAERPNNRHARHELGWIRGKQAAAFIRAGDRAGAAQALHEAADVSLGLHRDAPEDHTHLRSLAFLLDEIAQATDERPAAAPRDAIVGVLEDAVAAVVEHARVRSGGPRTELAVDELTLRVVLAAHGFGVEDRIAATLGRLDAVERLSRPSEDAAIHRWRTLAVLRLVEDGRVGPDRLARIVAAAPAGMRWTETDRRRLAAVDPGLLSAAAEPASGPGGDATDPRPATTGPARGSGEPPAREAAAAGRAAAGTAPSR